MTTQERLQNRKPVSLLVVFLLSVIAVPFALAISFYPSSGIKESLVLFFVILVMASPALWFIRRLWINNTPNFWGTDQVPPRHGP